MLTSVYRINLLEQADSTTNEEFAWLRLVQSGCYRPRPLQLGSHIAIVGASLSFPRAMPGHRCNPTFSVHQTDPLSRSIGNWFVRSIVVNLLTLKLRELRVYRDTSESNDPQARLFVSAPRPTDAIESALADIEIARHSAQDNARTNFTTGNRADCRGLIKKTRAPVPRGESRERRKKVAVVNRLGRKIGP